MNVFRVLGDVSHTLSKCILIWAIHSNRSAEGVSLITQMLYVAVFLTRYLDLFWVSPAVSYWNFILKNFYIFSSLYIILLMMKVYARTREREKAWRLGSYCLIGALVLAPALTGIDDAIDHKYFTFSDMLWNFSIVLESVCVVPQLLLLRQTTVPTVIDSFYLLTLGSYRAFYILNWIVRVAQHEHPDWQAVIFGVIQTALYVDFAWVYWTRQRVKLRNGGIVDSDDLSRGFLVSRVLGRGDAAMDDEERAGTNESHDGSAGLRKAGKWGTRGVSVSADEDVSESRPKSQGKGRLKEPTNSDDGLAGLMDSDNSEDEDASPENHTGLTNGNTHGNEWHDERGV
ncbi:ER lumen protein retaining receptor, partial [Lecanoromycetidae sp. Uapishka_2]